MIRPVARRTLLAAAGARALPSIARAARKPRIVMLLWRGWEEACDGFRDYLSGKGIAADYIIRDAGQTTATVPGLVADIKSIKPDLVFIWGGSTALAALGRYDAPDKTRFLTDIPAVLAIVADPLGSGLVSNLDKPGRPVTGTVYVAPVEVQLRAMEAYLPFKRIATLYNPQEQSSSAAVAQMAALAAKNRFEVLQQPVPIIDGAPSGSTIPAMVAAFEAAGAEWLYIPPDTFLNDLRDALTAAALANRLPAFSATKRFVTYARGLAGLVCRYYNIGQFAGFKAEQILNGTPAGTIPIQTLSRFRLLIRMQTAEQLEIYPPLSLLRYAEVV
jgi:putative ABC transport system substrate-binding protein